MEILGQDCVEINTLRGMAGSMNSSRPVPVGTRRPFVEHPISEVNRSSIATTVE
jgi:hypothetical protein